MKILNRAALPLLAAVLCSGASSSHAAMLDVFADLRSFLNAAGKNERSTQSFQDFATGVDISGIEVHPGVSAVFNLGELHTMNEVNRRIFGTGDRTLKNARYDISFNLPYTKFAFEIAAFQADDNPANQNIAALHDPGIVTVTLRDGSEKTIDVYGANGSPIFIGLIADTPISSVTWAETLTKSGRRNEATTLDNFTVLWSGPPVQQQVPAPTTLMLAVIALLGTAMRHARRAQRES